MAGADGHDEGHTPQVKAIGGTLEVHGIRHAGDKVDLARRKCANVRLTLEARIAH